MQNFTSFGAKMNPQCSTSSLCMLRHRSFKYNLCGLKLISDALHLNACMSFKAGRMDIKGLGLHLRVICCLLKVGG